MVFALGIDDYLMKSVFYLSVRFKERRIHVYFDSGSKEEERRVFFLSFSLSFFPFCVCLFFSFFAICIFSFYSYFFLVYPHFFHPPFTILIFPSASAIRRYPVHILQTPPLTTVKIGGRLNPFVTSEIRNLMRSRDR